MKRPLFLYYVLFLLLPVVPAPAQQAGDRYLEACADTLQPSALGTPFFRAFFSSRPQAFYLNHSAWDEGRAWEVRREGDTYDFRAARLANAFAPSAEEGFRADTLRVPASREVYECLGRLFRRAIAYTEDVDGHSAGLDGYTSYLAATDSAGQVRVASKWVPRPGTPVRALTDFCDTLYLRLCRRETDWDPTCREAEALCRAMEGEPLPANRPPVYRGIWRTGLQFPSQEQAKQLAETPRFPGYKDVEDYFQDYLTYPADLLAKGQDGYAVCQFTVDTLGHALHPFVLEQSHPAFGQEVCRLVAAMPHWLPALDREGQAVECMYCVYVPFRPGRYHSRLKAEKAREQEAAESFVDYESPASFPGGRTACMRFLEENTRYPAAWRGTGKQVRVIVQLTIDDYGRPRDIQLARGCGIREFDEEALRVVRLFPRWEPGVSWHPEPPHYRPARYTIPVRFTDPGEGEE